MKLTQPFRDRLKDIDYYREEGLPVAARELAHELTLEVYTTINRYQDTQSEAFVDALDGITRVLPKLDTVAAYQYLDRAESLFQTKEVTQWQ